jgi:hypothetical protein
MWERAEDKQLQSLSFKGKIRVLRCVDYEETGSGDVNCEFVHTSRLILKFLVP